MDLDRLQSVLPAKVNDDEMLVWRGRHLSVTVLLQVGDAECLIDIQRGKVAAVRRGPFVMPSWQFALRIDTDSWERFCQPLPPPGFHDLMALVKSRRLRIEGDLHPFMSNLLYFKSLLESVRLPRGAE